MKEREKQILINNLDKLVDCTNCSFRLLNKLVASGNISEEEAEELCKLGSGSQTGKFYEIIIEGNRDYQKLVTGLQETNQYEAVNILTDVKTEEDELVCDIAATLKEKMSLNDPKRDIISNISCKVNSCQELNLPEDPRELVNLTIDKLSLYGAKLLGRGRYDTFVYNILFNEGNRAVKSISTKLLDKSNATTEVDEIIDLEKHENIVQIFVTELNYNRFIFVMELCDISLHDWVIQKQLHIGPLEILRQTTTGLTFLHENRIAHGNLKPTNILLCSDHGPNIQVKISDIRPRIKIELCKSPVTVFDCDTAGWMAPEVLQAFNVQRGTEITLTPASDVFSLGCIYYFVMTEGKHPFGGRLRRPGNILASHYMVSLKHVTTVLPSSVCIVTSMTNKNQMLRPSAKSLLSHHIFWSANKALHFIHRVAECCQEESTSVNSCIHQLEENSTSILKFPSATVNWMNQLSPELQTEIKNFHLSQTQSARTGSTMNLINTIKYLSTSSKSEMGGSPEEFLEFWTKNNFPFLVPIIWISFKTMNNDMRLEPFYKNVDAVHYQVHDAVHLLRNNPASIMETIDSQADVEDSPIFETDSSVSEIKVNETDFLTLLKPRTETTKDSAYDSSSNYSGNSRMRNKLDRVNHLSKYLDLHKQEPKPFHLQNSKWSPETQVGNKDNLEPSLLVKFETRSDKRVNMEIQNEVMNTLLKSADGLPLCIVNIIGTQRLGKSIVLNTILQELEFLKRYERNYAMRTANKIFLRFNCKNTGKGQGMFVWPRTINLRTDRGKIAVLLMETNGLHDNVYGSAEALTSIFCLSFLLSSTLIYNCTENGLTDDACIYWLHFMLYGKKLIQEIQDSNERLVPNLSFLIRDWISRSNECSETANPCNFLREKVRCMSDGSDKEIVLNALAEGFYNADCTFLPPPGHAVQNPNFDGTVSELEEDFISRLGKYSDLIVSRLSSKKVLKTSMKPLLLKKLLPAYVQLINSYNDSNDTITADRLYTITSVTVSKCNFKEAEHYYKSLLEDELKKSNYLLESRMYTVHTDALQQACRLLLELGCSTIKDSRIQLTRKLNCLFSSYQQQNQQHRKDVIAEKLKPLVMQYKKQLKRRINFEKNQFYDKRFIENISIDCHKLINVKLLASFPIESDDGIREISQQLKKRTGQFLNSIMAKNAEICQGVTDRVMVSIKELRQRYQENLLKHLAETDNDKNSFVATHKLLKKQAVSDFRLMNLLGSKEVEKPFVVVLETQIEDTFAKFYNLQDDEFQVYSE